jgi:hypothetical protein
MSNGGLGASSSMPHLTHINFSPLISLTLDSKSFTVVIILSIISKLELFAMLI